MRDPYDVLGVSLTASVADIRSAYRRLAMQWHPDHNHDPSATARFQEIAAAYELLKDPMRRAAYDATRAGRRGEWEGYQRQQDGHREQPRREDCRPRTKTDPELDRLLAEFDDLLRITPSRIIAFFGWIETALRRAFA